MSQILFSDYKSKLVAEGISEESIYDFQTDKLRNVYQNYFYWCVENLDEWSSLFSLNKTFFYYWDIDKINSYAGHDGKEKYVITVTRGYFEALYNKLGEHGQFIGKSDWKAYHHLQSQISESLEFLMFQSSTIFTFYHEFAHLVQKQGKQFQMNEHPEIGDFNFENHLFEYDADLNGTTFACLYMLSFIEVLPSQIQSKSNIKRLMYLGISSIIINFLLFMYGEIYPFNPNNDNSFYVKANTHPHHYIRAKYVIDHYVQLAKANSIDIDYKETFKNVAFITNEYFKESGIFKNFLDGIDENFKDIQAYIFELYDAQIANLNCIKHKVYLFL